MLRVSIAQILRHSGAGRDYPTRTFCDLIPQVIEDLKRRCIENGAYEYAVSKQKEVPANVRMWAANGVYAANDYVEKDGCIYLSLVPANTSLPESNPDKWSVWEPFDNEFAKSLWRYLRRIIALRVYAQSLFSATFGSNAGGVTMNTGDNTGTRAANKDELTQLQKSLLVNEQQTFDNMVAFLQSSDLPDDYPKKGVCDECVTMPIRRRRWNFR